MLLDVLHAANRVRLSQARKAIFTVTTWGTEGTIISTGLGQSFRTQGPLSRMRAKPDIVIVPGQNQIDGVALATELRAEPALRLGRWLKAAFTNGAYLCASCSGVFHVAATKLLDGHTATTTWFFAPQFRAQFPHVLLDEHSSLICEGRLWTAGAALSIADLSLALVRKFGSQETAQDVTRHLILDTHPSQARYMTANHWATVDPTVDRAKSWIGENLRRAFSVGEVAASVGLSTRTLARRISAATQLSPIGFVQRIRAEQALHLLETTKHNVDEIAALVGYRNTSSLRRVLKRELGQSARALRGSSIHHETIARS